VKTGGVIVAQNTEVNYCEYCWRPKEMGSHNDGCPLLVGTDAAMAEFWRGWHYAVFEEEGRIHWWRYKYYSPTFLSGYRRAKSEFGSWCGC
jgi:hypothetical protein